MQSVFDIVVPVFCLIGLGYLIARWGYLSASAGDALADFVFKVAVPILLMRSIATAEFSQASPWIFVLVYFCSIGCVWVGAIIVIRWVFQRGSRASVIAGVAAGFSNLVLLGIPLIERAYGTAGLQVLMFLIAIHLPAMMAISTFLMEFAVRSDGVEDSRLRPQVIAQKLIKNLMVNPIIIGIFIGLIWRLSGIGVAGIPAQITDLIAKTTGPLALLSLGMGLIAYGIKGNLLPATCLALLGILVMPAIVYGLGTTVFELPPLWFQVALLAAACPTGVNAYLFANYFKIAEGLATNTIVLALLGSIITIPFWLSLT